ncbi:MAG: energy transducer TonB [Candidatus Korobacteraceae bacterium]|jgi:TonB family protein
MKTRTSYFVLILFLLLLAVASTQAQTTNADFQQAVSAYQQSPNDLNKAEKVIRMAAAMDQLPPIPEEARRHFVRGTALFKDAKTMVDYDQVAGEFKQAVHLAPWWPDARYNLALEQEAAGVYDWAIANLKLYLLFKLPDADAGAAQNKIYALEALPQKLEPEADVSKRVTISQGVIAGLLIRKIQPVYPLEARQNQIQGRVVLRAVIGKDGRIKNLTPISGPKELFQTSIGAVQQWQYRPYLLKGEPVEVDTQITVNFELRP